MQPKKVSNPLFLNSQTPQAIRRKTE